MVEVKRLTPKEIASLQEKVRKRDKERCVIHGTHTREVHEVLQRSSGAPRSAEVWQEKYMACLCVQCHYNVHHGGKKIEVNSKILLVLHSRFGYVYPKSILEKFKML